MNINSIEVFDKEFEYIKNLVNFYIFWIIL